MGKLLDKLRRVQAGGRPFCTMIVPAAGSAARMGGGDKLMMELEGVPVLVRTLRALDAAGLADIGTLFPDSDAALLNVSSILLLERVAQKLAESRVQVVNIDATLIAQAPKIAPYRAQMRRNIARALGIDPEQVGVKATTEEHLGFTGDGSGMAAHAVALVERN